MLTPNPTTEIAHVTINELVIMLTPHEGQPAVDVALLHGPDHLARLVLDRIEHAIGPTNTHRDTRPLGGAGGIDTKAGVRIEHEPALAGRSVDLVVVLISSRSRDWRSPRWMANPLLATCSRPNGRVVVLDVL